MSFTQHPASRAIHALTKKAGPAPAAPVLDSCKKEGEEIMDAANAAADYALADVRASGIAALQTWADTDPSSLDDSETLADRLLALMVGVADANKDGEISEDESAVIDIAMNAAYDYLLSKGVSDEDASALLNDGDDAVASRVAELLRSGAAGDDAAALAEIDSFVFDTDAQESVFDSAQACLDAVYRKTLAVRDGKKVRINKRVSGTVRLSAAQKVAIRKAQAKMHNASARVARMKSLKLRAKLGLNK